MSTLKAHNIEPATGTDVALGAAGDSVTVSGDSIKLNTFKDSGGNTLFISNGSGTLSSINSALKGNGPILISSQTASSSSTVEFTSGIDSTYDRYMFVFVNMRPSSDSVGFQFQANAVGQDGYNETITSTTHQAWHYESDSSQGVGYNTSADQAQGSSYQYITTSTGNASNESLSGILYLYSPSSTTYVKHFNVRVNENTANDISGDRWAAGYINVTAAITQISFRFESGNVADGKIKMYGVL